MSRSTFVVIPAHNEEPVLGDVLDELLAHCPDVRIVVVDDGSADNTFQVAASRPVIVLRHALNRGQGAALKTGISCALQLGAEIIVTYDADGQMLASDLLNVVEPVASGDYDVALGTRFGGDEPEGMTRLRLVLIKLALLFTRLTIHLPITDVHNGFRAFSRKACEAISLTHDRMAHTSEITREIARLGLRWTEVPVHIRYTEYSRRKGQSGMAAIDILADLLWRSRR